MSFHGGLLGVIVACWVYGRRHKIHFLDVMDFVSPLVPLGLAAGRMGNFINGELWGRASSLPWAMIFPQAGDNIARHPSQLYQFAGEGLLLFVLVWWFSAEAAGARRGGGDVHHGLCGVPLCRRICPPTRCVPRLSRWRLDHGPIAVHSDVCGRPGCFPESRANMFERIAQVRRHARDRIDSEPTGRGMPEIAGRARRSQQRGDRGIGDRALCPLCRTKACNSFFHVLAEEFNPDPGEVLALAERYAVSRSPENLIRL